MKSHKDAYNTLCTKITFEGKFDAQRQNLTSDVKSWSHRCVPPMSLCAVEHNIWCAVDFLTFVNIWTEQDHDFQWSIFLQCVADVKSRKRNHSIITLKRTQHSFPLLSGYLALFLVCYLQELKFVASGRQPISTLIFSCKGNSTIHLGPTTQDHQSPMKWAAHCLLCWFQLFIFQSILENFGRS